MSDSLNDEARRGTAAAQILENEVFKDAVALLQKRLIEDWIKTGPLDVASREWFHQQAVAQQAVVNALNKLVRNGKLATNDLALAAQEKQPRRSTRNG